jgi:Flp pilus assembly protein TadG
VTVRFLRRLRHDRRGATLVEFALVVGPFLVLLMGLIDIGYREYVGTVLHGTLNEAARRVTIGSVNINDIDAFVKGRLKRFSTDVVIEKSSYTRFGQVNRPEKITTDSTPLGSYNSGDCFEDTNRNGAWDSSGSGVGGTGNSDDIVYYTATVTIAAVVPVTRMLGWGNTETVTSTMAMRNQPFASQPQTPIVCK